MSRRDDNDARPPRPADPRGPKPAVVVRGVLPTAKHAMTLFDMVVERLGDRAWVQSSGGRTGRALYVRTGPNGLFVVPWPLIYAGFDESIAREEPETPPVPLEPDPLGGIDLMGTLHAIPGQFRLHDGAAPLTVEYGANGRATTCANGDSDYAYAAAADAVTAGTANRMELLVDYLAGLDIGRHGPARVICPSMRPGGVEGVWLAGKSAIREAISSGKIPSTPCWAAVDGYVGQVLTIGATRDGTLAAWRAEVERVRPQPPPRPKTTGFQRPPDESWEPTEWRGDEPERPEGAIEIIVRGWDAPPLDPSPSATPASLAPVSAIPPATRARGCTTRWLGDFGATRFAARIETNDGYILVGEQNVDRFDPSTIVETLDGVANATTPESAAEHSWSPPGEPPHTTLVLTYRCNDELIGAPIEPRSHGAQTASGLDGRGVDGDTFKRGIVRVRRFV